MKRGLIYLLLSIILMMSGYIKLDAQPCLPEGITFTTQSQIDSFPINYPNCDTIAGYVVIDGQDISNLNGLSNILAIEGSLKIGSNFSFTNPMLFDLQGLGNLSYIGGWLDMSLNMHLNSLDGLESLLTVDGYCLIHENYSLKNLNGLSNLITVGEILGITANDSLINLVGLNSLTVCGGVVVSSNDMLESLHGLESLTTIDKYHLMIWYNDNLVNLSGLENLTSIGTELQIQNNLALESLTGIDNLSHETIEYLSIDYNSSLTECDVQSICDYIADPQGSLWIYENDTGCNSVTEVEEACTVGIPEQGSATQLLTYPNPFITSTTLEYELKEISNIQFTIYNVIGEVVYMTVDRIMPQGKHTFTWTADRLPEGLYYAVMRSGEGVEVVKMIKQ